MFSVGTLYPKDENSSLFIFNYNTARLVASYVASLPDKMLEVLSNVYAQGPLTPVLISQ